MLAVTYKANMREATLRKRYLHVGRIVDATTACNPHDYVNEHRGNAMRCNYVIGRSSYMHPGRRDGSLRVKYSGAAEFREGS